MLLRLRQLFSTRTRLKAVASESSLVVTGDMRDSNINFGLRASDLQNHVTSPILREINQVAENLAREKGIDEGALRSILARIEDKPPLRSEIVAKLAQAIEQLIELRADLAKRASNNKNIEEVRQQASQQIALGQFSLASETLESGRLSARELAESGRKLEVTFLEDQAKLDLLQFSYRAAADKLGEAAKIMSHDKKASFDLLTRQATALQDLGELFGDDQALTESIHQWKAASSLASFDELPTENRKALNNLASALDALGERQTTNDLLDQAVTIQRELLAREMIVHESLFLATAQANLGSTLTKLGEREGNLTTLVEAAELLETAAKAIDKSTRRKDWVGVKSNIGNAYKLMGEISKNVEPLDVAIQLHEEALAALNVNEDLADWIRTKNNLGGVLISKGVLLRSESIFFKP